MATESFPEPASYRVTLFFGPESVEGISGVQVCVFNVKKRSWKAGIQVSVEITQEQLACLRHEIQLSDRIDQALMILSSEERPAYQERVEDLFAQAVAWCKLDLCLRVGLTQESQRIASTDFVPELDRAAVDRAEYVVAYVLTELGLVPDRPSP